MAEPNDSGPGAEADQAQSTAAESPPAGEPGDPAGSPDSAAAAEDTSLLSRAGPTKARRWVGLPTPTRKRWGQDPKAKLELMEACLVAKTRGWLGHFVLMMTMSVIVAIMGLSANSAALVIGAMLIAPLMTPVLGIAASIALADHIGIARTVLIVASATLGAIALSWAIAGVLPGQLLTGEVLARTAPDVRDLVVALAAGVAGSYATARPGTSSSLPGVAIAVALVPPLGVVGITLRAGEATLAQGALLLYATNLVAIVAVSTIVFLATGYVPARSLADSVVRVASGWLVALVLAAVFGTLLTTRSIESAQRANDVAAIREAAGTWLEGTFNESEVDVDGTVVRIRVTGPEAPPAAADLALRIEEILATEPDLQITWFQAETNSSLTAAAAASAAVEELRQAEPAIRSTIEEWMLAAEDSPGYELSRLDIGADGLSVEIASSVQTPPRDDLAALIEERLGRPVAVDVTWRDTSVEAAEAEQLAIDAAESDARLAVFEWAGVNGVDVESVTYDGNSIVVDLSGERRPESGRLRDLIEAAVPGVAEVRVWFTERVPVVPAPTPTPTPEPTATPVPTPTPSPSPEPTATPGG